MYVYFSFDFLYQVPLDLSSHVNLSRSPRSLTSSAMLQEVWQTPAETAARSSRVRRQLRQLQSSQKG